MRTADKSQKVNILTSIYCDERKVKITLTDDKACITFLELTIPPAKFTALLGRLANVKCKAEVRGLNKVGKIRENKPLIFQMPEGTLYGDKDVAAAEAQKQADEGWEPSLYFGSQDSFTYREVNGKTVLFAKTMQFRWV